jgi:1,2-diacylglycerol 3-beta-galactosyltransferase
MTAADILITKAGPATICESCITGLPIIISDFIPGQEYGNVDYVTENDVGVYAPSYDQIVETLRNWLADKPGLQKRSENARKLGRPDAVQEIAAGIWEQAQRPPIKNDNN